MLPKQYHPIAQRHVSIPGKLYWRWVVYWCPVRHRDTYALQDRHGRYLTNEWFVPDEDAPMFQPYKLWHTMDDLSASANALRDALNSYYMRNPEEPTYTHRMNFYLLDFEDMHGPGSYEITTDAADHELRSKVFR